MQKNIPKYRRRKIYTKTLAHPKNLADAKSLADGKNLAPGKILAPANVGAGKVGWRTALLFRLGRICTADSSQVLLMVSFSSLLMISYKSTWISSFPLMISYKST
jgi:hypothetical protein